MSNQQLITYNMSKNLIEVQRKAVLRWFSDNSLFIDYQNEILNEDFFIEHSYIASSIVKTNKKILGFTFEAKRRALQNVVTKIAEHHIIVMDISSYHVKFKIEYHTISKIFKFRLSYLPESLREECEMPKSIANDYNLIWSTVEHLFDKMMFSINEMSK